MVTHSMSRCWHRAMSGFEPKSNSTTCTFDLYPAIFRVESDLIMREETGRT